jgi:hypothetical protein
MNATSATPLLISSLPGPDHLQALERAGFRRLINLSGVDLAEIYGHQALADFQSERFVFADVFSCGNLIPPIGLGNEPPKMDEAPYLASASKTERQQFLAAILATNRALSEGDPVLVFCDRGIGRSPVVALAALLCRGHHDLMAGLHCIAQLQPRAVVTEMSLSALAWSQKVCAE